MSLEKWDPILSWLVDTCVWLDVAKDHRREQTLSVLEERTRLGDVSLMVLTAVLAEFGKHKARIVDESQRSFSPASKCVKEAVVDLGKGNSGSTPAMSAAGCGGAPACRPTAGGALQRPYGITPASGDG